MSEAVPVEDVQSRAEQRESALYAGRVWVYPKAVRGSFRQIKWAALFVLLGLYYLVPWLRWDRGPNLPDQAVLADMPGRRLFFFWIEIWPQEVYFLTGVLILAAVGLFLATSLFGRIWCGYACPQTVWTDLYMWVERAIEGDRAARIRLDKQPWSFHKILKKTSKHGVWILIAAATGGAWIMYFNDAPSVTVAILTGEASLAVYFFFGLFTGTTYLLAGWAREQVCTYMCPWPRIQGALLDQDSLAVTYREWRGEPRAPHKRGTTWEGRGDCIDCRQCVAVCPTGIDIRDGLQLECIGCGLCIDACNDVMDRVGRPRFLIAWDSERNQELLADKKPPAYRLVRARTIVYTAIIALVALIMLAALLLRAGSEISILHDRNPLFVTLSDGSIRNGYTVKILNKSHEPRTYRVTLADDLPATLTAVGAESPDTSEVDVTVPADGVGTFQLYLALPADAVTGDVMDLTFELSDEETGEVRRQPAVFRGPAK